MAKFNRYINTRPQDLSPEDRLRPSLARGMPSRRLAGGWVDDLAALGKAILLCWKCSRKFNCQSVGYEKVEPVTPGYNYVISKCDGCKSEQQCGLYQKSRTLK